MMCHTIPTHWKRDAGSRSPHQSSRTYELVAGGVLLSQLIFVTETWSSDVCGAATPGGSVVE